MKYVRILEWTTTNQSATSQASGGGRKPMPHLNMGASDVKIYKYAGVLQQKGDVT